MRNLIKRPPFVFAFLLVAAFGVFALSPMRECKAPIVQEVAAGGETSHEWTNCSIVQIPLEIGMEIQNVTENPGGGQEKGGLVEVLLSVTPLLEAKNVTWRLELPAEVKSYSGPADWSGIVGKDQTASFVFTLSLPDGKEYYIDAVGQYEAVTGAMVRKAKSLELDLGTPEPEANPSFIRVDETGRKVVSYRGTTLGGGQ
jgi:hypothetical protein